MTLQEFNKKYNSFLEDRFYGLEIMDEIIIDFLDSVFEVETKKEVWNDKKQIFERFSYSQIKLKFDKARIYTNNHTLNTILENSINEYLNK